MADIIETTINSLKLAELKAERVVPVSTEPILTATIVKNVVAVIKEGKIKGYTDIADSIGFDKVSREQVKKINERMNARVAELSQPIDLAPAIEEVPLEVTE